jgi:hypothetical protein
MQTKKSLYFSNEEDMYPIFSGVNQSILATSSPFGAYE